MDFTKIKCISEQCKDKNIIMSGAGSVWGGRVGYSTLKCPECGLKLMIMPVDENLEYTITAKTEEERKELLSQQEG